jgi:glycosyltransferase involved in cell wall biosynthesis
MGGENHFPNYDGLKWFLTDVSPLFGAALPKLYVTGNWQDTTKNEFRKLYINIQFTGFVEDLLPYLTNSISIVPIRMGGGGMRTKVLYAMANNVPVVTTSVALAGIDGENNKHYLKADTTQDFANQISELMANRIKAIEIIRSAAIMVKSRYSQTVMGERRNGFYNQIFES